LFLVTRHWQISWSNLIGTPTKQVASWQNAGEFSADELRGMRRLSVAGFPRHLIFYQAREHVDDGLPEHRPDGHDWYSGLSLL
jgi:hypothetical protein